MIAWLEPIFRASKDRDVALVQTVEGSKTHPPVGRPRTHRAAARQRDRSARRSCGWGICRSLRVVEPVRTHQGFLIEI